VREAAVSIVSGLARMSDEEQRAHMQEQLEELARTKLPASRQDASHSACIARRHGGVLGLAALVRACPYTVPQWLPGVLDLLADHANDPYPLNTTVKATVAEFKRTHQDNWEECRQAFTEDQLTHILESTSALAHRPPRWPVPIARVKCHPSCRLDGCTRKRYK